eukprot:TRINITY_DN25218_c0_g1_i1.p1 TRINITY_DN25218_c0_g1~~TRINITY_DN25218_c0_g1_i1.p1  ORF type:complete len:722 (-),score=125.26 TRINITY_DN25218_c0_g1_i1:848-3013(-)
MSTTPPLSEYRRFEAPAYRRQQSTAYYHEDIEKWEVTEKQTVSPVVATVTNKPFARLVALLVCTGVIASALSFTCDVFIFFAAAKRRELLASYSYLGALAAGLLLAAFFSAASRFVVSRDARAEGSGIPELACCLVGASLEGYFTLRTLCVKLIGLSFARAAVLPIGKEGPFVHFATCTCALLQESFPAFRGLFADRTTHRRAMLAAAAAGVSVCFSSPIGGVLFALEVVGIYFVSEDLTISFFASGTGAVVYYLLKSAWMEVSGESLQPLPDEPLEPLGKDWFMFLVLALVLGAVAGCLAQVFLAAHARLNAALGYWRSHGFTCCHRRFHEAGTLRFAAAGSRDLNGGAATEWFKPRTRASLLVVVVAIVNQAIILHIPLLREPKMEMSQLFSPGEVTLPDLFGFESGFWSKMPESAYLTCSLVVQMVLVIWALNLPIPCGCIWPSYMLGALLGRLFGNLVAATGLMKREANFAVIGACAFPSGICQAFSMAIVVFENLNADVPQMLLPMVAAAMSANVCSNWLGPSFFDSMLVRKKLPGIPHRACSAGRGFISAGIAMRPASEDGIRVFASELAEQIPALRFHHDHVSNYVCVTEDNGALKHCLRRQELLELSDNRTLQHCQLIKLPTVAPWVAVEEALVMMAMTETDAVCVVDDTGAVKDNFMGIVLRQDLADFERMVERQRQYQNLDLEGESRSQPGLARKVTSTTRAATSASSLTC